MAPKKKGLNGFAVFMTETRQELLKKGIQINMSEMPNYCKKDWEQMSDDMKQMYKSRGKEMGKQKIVKYTSIGEEVNEIKKQLENVKSQSNAMYSYIEELVCMHPTKYFLPKQKFILIHVNSYTCESEGFYFPAEISMAEFSLERGLTRVFHQLIGFDQVRTNAPIAPAADINNHAKNNHLINSYTKLPNNYTDILLKIIGFIIQKNVDEAVLNDSSLDMPSLYTAHTSTGNELMITTSSLYQLYQSAVKTAYKDDFNNFFRVYHLDKLFMEVKNKSYNIRYPDVFEKAIPSVAMATESLSKDMFDTIKCIGCEFHEKHEHAHVCSNYYVCKWIYIFSTHCCQFLNIKLVSGCHFNFDLSRIQTPVEEIIENLNISKINHFKDYNLKKQFQSLTPSDFPATFGELSTTSTQCPIWNKPALKSDHKMNTPSKTVLNNDNNFPPLGRPQKVILEKKPTSKMNSWQKNISHSKDIVNKIHTNDANQLNINPNKLSRDRGFNGKK